MARSCPSWASLLLLLLLAFCLPERDGECSLARVLVQMAEPTKRPLGARDVLLKLSPCTGAALLAADRHGRARAVGAIASGCVHALIKHSPGGSFRRRPISTRPLAFHCSELAPRLDAYRLDLARAGRPLDEDHPRNRWPPDGTRRHASPSQSHRTSVSAARGACMSSAAREDYFGNRTILASPARHSRAGKLRLVFIRLQLLAYAHRL